MSNAENKYEFFTYAVRPNGGLTDTQIDNIRSYLANLEGNDHLKMYCYGIETTCNTSGYCNASTRHMHICVVLHTPCRTRAVAIKSLDPEYTRVSVGPKHKFKFILERDLATIGYCIKGYWFHTYGMSRKFIVDAHIAWNNKDRSIHAKIEKRVVISRNNLSQIVGTHANRLTTEDFVPNVYHVLIDMVRSKEYTFTMLPYQVRLPLEYHSKDMSDMAIVQCFTNKIKSSNKNDDYSRLIQSLYAIQIDIDDFKPQPYTGNSSISYPKINFGGTSHLGSTTQVTPGQITQDTEDDTTSDESLIKYHSDDPDFNSTSDFY